MISALQTFFKDIKLSHSVFAMPFALSIFTFLNIQSSDLFNPLFLILIIICIVSARTFAMGMNRYLDWKIDAENIRTKLRSIPAGKISKNSVLIISLVSGLIFIAASFVLKPLCGYLSFFILLILGFYPAMKKISYFTHYYLGFCLALAPLGVAVASSENFNFPASVYFICAGVMLWTGGFDILYALQDIAFDRAKNLHSIPARFGVNAAINISRISFAGMITCLIASGILAHKNSYYFIGVGVVAIILTLEHLLIRDAKNNHGHSKNINLAFFNLNAFCSVFFLVFCVMDLYL